MEWLNPFLSFLSFNFIFQEQHPEKLEVACQDKLVVCLPDASSVRTDLGGLDSDFFDLHILREKVEEGWYSSINPSLLGLGVRVRPPRWSRVKVGFTRLKVE